MSATPGRCDHATAHTLTPAGSDSRDTGKPADGLGAHPDVVPMRVFAALRRVSTHGDMPPDGYFMKCGEEAV